MAIDITCLTNGVHAPSAYLSCAYSLSSGYIWHLVYYMFVLIMIISWTRTHGISRGLPIAGYFSIMFALVLSIINYFGLITIPFPTIYFVISILITVIGIILLLIEIKGNE